MLRLVHAAGAVRRTRPLLAYNKSSGYRWTPIPKPPPPHYDRLYGVHSVLNTLRVAAQRHQQQQQQQQPLLASRDALCAEGHSSESRSSNPQASRSFSDVKQHSESSTSSSAALHPHRAHLTCLYVRDFSVEEDDNGAPSHHRNNANIKRKGGQHPGNDKTDNPTRRKKKVIPPRYTAVRCIAALAKSLDVPVRFVPRSELVQLCGERRNQNVVLEASTYAPHPIQRLEDIWAASNTTEKQAEAHASCTTVNATENQTPSDPAASCNFPAPPARELVLFLEHIIDPTNIGGILRTAFFFGVDHVILSRDCAACTATVSRASTGFLEHLRVHRLTVPTVDFLQAARQAYPAHKEGSLNEEPTSKLDIVASAVVSGEPGPDASQSPFADALPHTSGPDAEAAGQALKESEAVTQRDALSNDLTSRRAESKPSACQRNVRLLLLGNEDAGLPPQLLRWCTHVAHVTSPRQLRLRQARRKGMQLPNHNSNIHLEHEDALLLSPQMNDHAKEGSVTDAAPVLRRDSPSPSCSAAHRSLSEVEKRDHNLQRLARLREKEVSLNVNTATGALLTALVAVEGDLPAQASLGMVEVQACK